MSGHGSGTTLGAPLPTMRYLGCAIEVGPRELAIRDQHGRLIAQGRYELSGARRIIRGYRKAA